MAGSFTGVGLQARNRTRSQAEPDTGKLLRRPDATWSGLFSLSEARATFFPVCSFATGVLRQGLNVRFLRHRGIYRPMWVPKNQAWTGATASRQPLQSKPDNAPGGSRHPIVPMSSDRLILEGLVATRAPLRFTGTINLP